MLVYERERQRTSHGVVRDLPEWLRPGDLLVLNDTRVLGHRLVGQRSSGARVEVLILQREGEECRGFVKPARKIRSDEVVALEGGALELSQAERLGDGGKMSFRLSAPSASLEEVLDRVGRAPLPPYIQREDDEDPRIDRERYQTVFAKEPGAVAAPTAGLHFTERLLTALEERGVSRAFVTLHVGEGTFEPVRCDEVEDHAMHSERYVLPEATAEAIAKTRRDGGRVVAVGTTSARVLESCPAADRHVEPGSGATELFLYPGRPLQVVDGLLTNFHLPESTLVMLVAAFCGREEVLQLYETAVAEGYRFYSYGDAMLLL